jgi:hypothetical protein
MPPLVRRKDAQGKRARQRLTTVAFRQKSSFLNFNLCFGASDWHARTSGQPAPQRRRRALVVDIGKGGPGYGLDSQVLEALYPGFQAGDAVSQTNSSSELHSEQMHQLAPTGKRPGFPTSAMLGFQLAKIMSRNKFKVLRKDCVRIDYDPNSPFLLLSVG